MNIIPIKRNSKIPAIKWLKYQKEMLPRKDLQYYNGLNRAVICGDISDGLVILDFDFEGKPYFKNILDKIKNFKTHIVQTPNGLHVYFRIEGICPERQTQIKAKLPEIKAFDVLVNLCNALVPQYNIHYNYYPEINNYPIKKISPF